MPKYEVDIEQKNYGIITVEANSEEEAMEIVASGQAPPEEIYTGSEIRPIEARIACF